MNTRFCSLALALALAASLPGLAQAQYYYDDYDWGETYEEYVYYEDDYAPLTGDPALDALLETINARFNDAPVYYAERLAVDARLEPTLLRSYLVERRYAPADVYMMAELAQLTGKPVGEVATAYSSHRGRGWGVVARSLGIKPGSPQFHQLKRGGTTWVSAPPAGAPVRGMRTPGPRGPEVHPGKGPGKARDRGPGNGQGKGRGKGPGSGKGKGPGNGKGKNK